MYLAVELRHVFAQVAVWAAGDLWRAACQEPRKSASLRRVDSLAGRIWTVTVTAEMAWLNVLTYLTAYLDACGRNGGKPLSGADLERFLTWNATAADGRAWAHPPPPS